MLKLLIVCRELKQSKDYVNWIVGRFSNIRLIGIANTISEAQGIMIRDKPDIILTNIPYILKFVKEMFILHLPRILLISKANKPKNLPPNVFFINGNISLPAIKLRITRFMEENIKQSKKEEVTQLLIDLGFDFKIAGTNFLLDAILYTHSYDGSHYFERLGRDVYSYVAKINDTSAEKVGWAINRSVAYMYEKHTKKSYSNVEKYFKITYPEKPTPKLIINLIANNLDS